MQGGGVEAGRSAKSSKTHLTKNSGEHNSQTLLQSLHSKPKIQVQQSL